MLAVFLLTFVTARILVFLIMARKLPPWLFFHAHGTHVHHLNYGIFLLSGVGAYLLFACPTGRRLTFAAGVHAVGLGLTFDEFGMWLHLGGPYWQRASFDAVVVIASLLGLFVAAPSIRRFHRAHWIGSAVLAVILALFAWMLRDSFRYAGKHLGPKLMQMEENGPP